MCESSQVSICIKKFFLVNITVQVIVTVKSVGLLSLSSVPVTSVTKESDYSDSPFLCNGGVLNQGWNPQDQTDIFFKSRRTKTSEYDGERGHIKY